MPRSSELVAALASALAKAQAELVNPEKSLTASIRTGRPGRGSVASVMRPSPAASTSCARRWAQHEIATVQTTAIDQTRWHGQSDHHARARLRRMDRIGLAGLSDQPKLPIPSAWAPR